MHNMTQEDTVRLNLVKLFKHFGNSNMPVNESVFAEYCKKEGIADISFEQYQDRLLDYKQDQVIKESLPHVFRILAENAELHISDFDLSSKVEETAQRISKVQAEIAHLFKRADVPYDQHGDITYTISRIVNALLDQATDTNRKDITLVIEHMGRKQFGRDITMADIAEYNQNEIRKS